MTPVHRIVAALVLSVATAAPVLASPIQTSDFSTLFGAGSLEVLPSGLGGGTSGSTAFAGGEVSGSLDYAVWRREVDDLLVFVYDLTLDGASAGITGFAPWDDAAAEGSFVSFDGLGFAAGVEELGGGIGTVATDVGVSYVNFGAKFAHPHVTDSALLGGESYKRLVLAVDANSVTTSDQAHTEGTQFSFGPVPLPSLEAASAAVPEPGALALLGVAAAGLVTQRSSRFEPRAS